MDKQAMSDLGNAIRGVRTRLGKTMVEFAALIGAKQSTVSRYESGKLVPGRPSLLLLLQLAAGHERWPILGALGVDKRLAHDWNERRLIDALRTFEYYLEASTSQRAVQEASPRPLSPLDAFAEAAKKIILECQNVDLSLVTILNHWLKHYENPETLEFFRHAAAYLDVELTASDLRRDKTGRRSRARRRSPSGGGPTSTAA